MNFSNFTPSQKVLIHSIVNKIDHSGCGTEEIVEVLSEVIGSLLAYVAPTKEELAEYLDKKLLPALRRDTLDRYDIKHIKI